MANLYTVVNGKMVSNELTPALIASLNKIAAAGDYIAVPAGAAYMVTVDFEDGAAFYGPDDIAALAADIAGLIDDNPADIANGVWNLAPGGRAYFDFVTAARIA